MSPALRVLMVSDVSPLRPEGGAERMLWEQARRLAARGHDVRILCRSHPDGASGRTERERVRIDPFPVDRRPLAGFIRTSILSARRAVSAALAAEGADVLHLHQPLAAYGALLSGAGRRLPSLYSFYSPAPLEYRSRRGMTRHHLGGWAGGLGVAALWTIERACLRRARLIHVLSDFSAEQLWTLYGVPAERIVKIAGAVDLERFRPAADRAAVRSQLGLPADRPVLFTVRNLEPRMGLDGLLRAMAILRLQAPRALLLIGGAGSLRGELEAQSAALGLGDHVRFLGFVPDATLARYYQAADLFVLPTRELEGFGLVTVEALACGTPVLGTPVGATPEILSPLSPSLLFKSLVPEEMADDLRRFLEAKERDPDADARFRQACRRYAESRFGWDREVVELEQALARAGGPRAAGTDPPVACPACGASTVPSALLYRGARYRRCRRCRSSVVAKPPTAIELRRYYEIDYPRRFRPERLTRQRAALFDALLVRCEKLGAPAALLRPLLDVGCGGGHLVGAARQRGWQAVGADLAWEACATARRVGQIPVAQADCAELPFRSGAVGVVALVNVLDQAGEPVAILREAHRVLGPDGWLLIRVPNAAFHRWWVRVLASLGPFVRSREWDQYPVLHHFAFTGSGLRRVVERAGFTVVEVGNSTLVAGSRRRSWRAAVVAGADAVAAASRGRWLIGPSLALYARKEAE